MKATTTPTLQVYAIKTFYGKLPEPAAKFAKTLTRFGIGFTEQGQSKIAIFRSDVENAGELAKSTSLWKALSFEFATRPDMRYLILE